MTVILSNVRALHGVGQQYRPEPVDVVLDGELIAAIEHFIENYNDRAQPFVWTKTAEHILAKATRDQ